jgi:hypothetical protein
MSGAQFTATALRIRDFYEMRSQAQLQSIPRAGRTRNFEKLESRFFCAAAAVAE